MNWRIGEWGKKREKEIEINKKEWNKNRMNWEE